MPKRKIEDKIERYLRKIKKLEGKQRQYQRIIYSSSNSDVSDNEDVVVAGTESLKSVVQDATQNHNEEDKTEELDLDLDPEILSALGESTEEVPKFGPKIHDSLSRLWTPILKKGINKETKEKLLKDYPIPENCALLQAPKLNPEISAAISEGTRARDKRVEAVQQQLGQGIAALNKALELLLDDGKDRLQAIKFLSDSSRILCDLHHIESEARKKFITPELDKSFLNIMQDVDRDELLFGNALSEKIKATKVIEKHGLQIKKPPPNPKPSHTPFQSQASTSRSRHQGNWMGPPRFSSNKGGRGGPKRQAAPASRRAPSGNTAQKQPAQSKQPRATGQQ